MSLWKKPFKISYCIPINVIKLRKNLINVPKKDTHTCTFIAVPQMQEIHENVHEMQQELS